MAVFPRADSSVQDHRDAYLDDSGELWDFDHSSCWEFDGIWFRIMSSRLDPGSFLEVLAVIKPCRDRFGNGTKRFGNFFGCWIIVLNFKRADITHFLRCLVCFLFSFLTNLGSNYSVVWDLATFHLLDLGDDAGDGGLPQGHFGA